MITRKEIRRQATHLMVGLIIVLLIHLNILNLLYMTIATLICLALSLMIKSRIKVPLIEEILCLQRRYEQKGMPLKGAFFYMLGSTIALALYSKEAAIASILILAVGDSTSRLIGPFGDLPHPFNNKKFLEGIIAGAVASIAAASLIVPIIPAIVASLGAMIIEGLHIEIFNFKIDDNLTIPIIAGFLLSIFL